MVISASYYIENDADFKAALNDAATKVSDLRIAFKLIQNDWMKANQAQFSLKGSGQYPPLSPTYAARKAITHPGAPILVRSGRLRDSMTKKGTADTISEIGRLNMVLGTRVPYGIYHQNDAPRSKMPLRKFLFIGPDGPANADGRTRGKLERWLGIIAGEIERQLKDVK